MLGGELLTCGYSSLASNRQLRLPEEKRKVRITESAVDMCAGGEAVPTGCLITAVMGDG